MLWDTARGIGDPLVRNRGTMAGAVAHGDPAADWPAALLALNGEVVATGSGAPRIIPMTELYIAILTTSLASDELLTEIRVPLPAQRSGGAYEKLERKVGDYAVIGVAAQVTLDAANDVVEAGIGLCNAGSISIKAHDAEAFLMGKPAVHSMVASRRRAETVLTQLRLEGVDEKVLGRLKAPGGLDIGAATGAEIALSILAGITQRSGARVISEVPPPTKAMAIDPICGMEVDPTTAKWSAERGGETYYFCAPGCRRALLGAPATL